MRRVSSRSSPIESLEDLKVRGQWALADTRSIIDDMLRHAMAINRDSELMRFHDYDDERPRLA